MPIRWKVTLSTLLAVTLGLAVAGWLALRSIEGLELTRLHQSLESRTGLAVLLIQPALPDQTKLRETARAAAAQALARVTVIAPTGVVLADTDTSESALPTLENHATRPEVAAALGGSHGTDVRLSHTTGKRMAYLAVPVRAADHSIQAVVRLALPLTELEARVAELKRNLAVAFGAAFLTAMFVSVLLSRGLTRPFSAMASVARQLAAGSLAQRIEPITRDEIGVLATTFNQMADRLASTIHELTEDRARLRRLESIRKDFVANVSHELRTPLTSIKGYVEALLDDASASREQREQFLKVVLTHADRLNLILDDLLQLSHIESGQVIFKREPVVLQTVIERTLALIKPLADKKRHEIVVDCPPTTPPVRGDEDRLVQVMTNLVDNAVKYTPERGSIRIVARPSGQTVEVTVSDSGIGIPEADRPRVFERFYRVDKARSRELGGTGLGLAIVKHIVEGHDGQVFVEPNVPRGSCFIVRLPAATAAD